jgi:serine/threonine-protein kinase
MVSEHSEMSEQDALTIGTVIDDRYRLISEGSLEDLGTAYTAYDLQGDRLVNLRVVDASWGSGQEALDRLQLAEQSFVTLHAPGLIFYEQTGLVEGHLYLVHPHGDHQTLAALLAHNLRLDTETAVALTIRLCEALAPAHHAGLTHGSLSPHCVLVKERTEDDDLSAAEVMVLDAGLIPALQPTDTSAHKPWGRLPHTTPEQADGHGVQPSSDVYVIGALLYEMLIGRPPFRADDEAVVVLQHLHQEPPSLQIMDTSIPRSLAQIVYNALAKEPASRYRNAGQLAHILRSQVASAPQVAPPSPQVAPSPQGAAPPQPVQPVRQDHLVVPPPPTPSAGGTWSSSESYDPEGYGAWEQKPEREGIDWMMIALLIAALIAVLGLIPLWRAVYSRYVTGPASSSLAPHRFEVDAVCDPLGASHQDRQPIEGPQGQAELDERTVVWYNTMPSRRSLGHLHPAIGPASHQDGCGEEDPHSGVQLTGPEREV